MTSTPDLRGLTEAEVQERHATGRTHTMPPASGRSVWEIVRANTLTRINAILLTLFVLVISTGRWINGAFGLLIIANSGIGIIQELRAKRTLDRLSIVGETRPQVRRVEGGRAVVKELAQSDIVADDLIEVGPGDEFIVDGTLVEAAELEVDESLLTGEADPMVKVGGDEVLSGSFVVAGTGTYRAEKVGAESYAAQLTAEASRFTLVNSQLRNGIDSILKVITWIIIPVGILTIINQVSTAQNDWRNAINGMVAALVPMVPEGLVLITIVAFAVGVVRLGQRQCLVQELPAIEGLARVDVVCADKTGTLTENGMRLQEVIALGTDRALLEAALTSLAAADPRPNASMEAIKEGLVDGGVAQDAWSASATAAFSSARKWSGASFGERGNWVIGAPDVLAPPGSPAAQQAEEIGQEGLRVLLLGTCAQPVDAEGAPGEVSPCGLVVLKQRIRPEAQGTLDFFTAQGVAVKVISGDNALSVGAVTSSLNIAGGERPMDARKLPNDPQELAAVMEETTVFGRVTPAQKRAMVGALQSRGHTVAMTGDGVNDVLALKDADIGVAMGSGSAASRGVAEIVLLNNSFASLPHVVAEGRRVIGNIERVANLFLTKTVYSALFALLIGISSAFNLIDSRYPFQAIHVTITGWFTIGIPAFLLALAPNYERARTGFVARVMRLALPAGAIVAVSSFAAYILTYPRFGATPAQGDQATTAALIAQLIAATWVLAVVARPWEWWKVSLIGLSLVAYSIIFLLPATQTWFYLDMSNPVAWGTGIAVGLAGAVGIEVAWRLGNELAGQRPPLWKPRDSAIPAAVAAPEPQED